jgi:hypothetical protein
MLKGRLRHEVTEKIKNRFHRGDAEARRKPKKIMEGAEKTRSTSDRENGIKNLR